MKGRVDDSLRALIDVSVSAASGSEAAPRAAWVDTAFNGGLVLPRIQIERIGLKQASTAQALLADGHSVDAETFTCYLKWFGETYRTQVVANDGTIALLGTMLLAGRKLTIDYQRKIVTLD